MAMHCDVVFLNESGVVVYSLLMDLVLVLVLSWMSFCRLLYNCISHYRYYGDLVMSNFLFNRTRDMVYLGLSLG